ncbi:hypothetical protein DFH08DRAFT_945523 [Mycena albidolilacea]|uniref:Uncharacterized protein n=1 Tax=Mycena albidolilacea TaxID=1033008 RepID=A0AAD6Z142_9AGAR|nr:hypothetical protein DFH08DRAFT_945523 [Mycena albidolilacea]
MSETTTAGHHTRAATRAGLYDAPAPIYGPSATSSPTDDVRGSIEDGRNSPHPIATLYSTVVTGGPVPLERGISPSVSDARLSSIEPAPLRGGADFGPAVVENQQDDGDWIPVTRSTARTHRPHSALGGSIPRQNTVAVPTAQASTPSTVVRATNEMSREDYEALARRYQAMADDARSAAEISDTRVEQASHSAVLGDSGSLGDSLGNQGNIISGSNVAIATEKQDGSSVELLVPISPISSPIPGPSRAKGKGVDPGNWGNTSFLGNFSEKDFQEQRDAFENYAEINRVLKEETITTPPDFFDDLRDPELSGGSPPAVTGNPHIVFQSGQTKDEKIAELEAQLSYFEQWAPKKPVISEPKKSQTKTVVDDYITKLVRPDQKLKKPNANHVRMTPGLIAIGSTLDKAIRGSAKQAFISSSSSSADVFP